MNRAAVAAFAVAFGIGLGPVAWAQSTTTGSMTEAQVLSRLEAAGLRNIRDLTQQSDGTWRAQVTPGSGGNVLARIDTQGNIVLNTGLPVRRSATTQTPGAGMAESDARSHLEAAGLQNIRDLTQQSDGSWRAQVSSAGGGNVQARIDPEGNISLNTGVPTRQ
ncbi:hypothetical protein KPL78_08365 [Roseomonas sp. HJA6]|uniref:PepSY domain-containing protein n=1 Tax=Roseomonas alba TaxID=2846776 RepID=A0ABS7A6C4_9PROT|nr:hypothetical protein [Neoroseomonas alba]MBW6397854.1 hypothetical protein [Neoroseomonas alba]